jgi:hypothetical protein
MPIPRYGLTRNEVRWIEDVLSNDENSNNEELVKYFIEGGLNLQQIKSVLQHREDYLLNTYFNEQGPLYLA